MGKGHESVVSNETCPDSVPAAKPCTRAPRGTRKEGAKPEPGKAGKASKKSKPTLADASQVLATTGLPPSPTAGSTPPIETDLTPVPEVRPRRRTARDSGEPSKTGEKGKPEKSRGKRQPGKPAKTGGKTKSAKVSKSKASECDQAAAGDAAQISEDVDAAPASEIMDAARTSEAIEMPLGPAPASLPPEPGGEEKPPVPAINNAPVEIRSIPMPEAWQRQRTAQIPGKQTKRIEPVVPAPGRVPQIPASFSPALRRLPATTTRRDIPLGKVSPLPAVSMAAEPVPALVPDLPPPPVRGRWSDLRRRLGGRRTMIVCGVMVALLLVFRHEGASWLTRLHAGGRKAAEQSPSWSRYTAEEWYQQAREHAEEGDFRLALGAVRYALRASSPDDAELLDFEGDMHQSLFQFHEAQAAYAQVVRLDPQAVDARQNLVLCRRLNRYRLAPETQTSTLYGLHRVMLGQKRVAEARAISQRLHSDLALQQETWQAALDQTGLSGKATVDKNGALALDLSGGPLRPDLSRLNGFPVASLNLAGTGVESIGALRGMPLEQLDLSGTPVHDLAPLRGMPLRTLKAPGTGVVEISALAGCSQLRELDLSRTRVPDLTPLANLPLSTLQVAGTPVADVRPLETLPLKRLDLSKTRVSDLGPLSSLGLEFLGLAQTPVSDLSALRGCALRELELSGTNVTDLTPLAGMPLTSLDLAGCHRLKTLAPLATCMELEHLELPTKVTNRDALVKLPRLRFVRGS